ncbi:GNAT family N-acetyltransferase [Pseudanabaena sp. FACHB-2040]|uniref:GNAT family N-acetyltransferase n=1 Tax=Pseudanabaena sp. FACHB-2040 TaxID=2692859 RepID=UPI001682B8BC|nr:GNAT family N-acetyltransferase [Pseudanabaena sp. FACHB-2040]MBD2258425.1 GNAT family N-acetyltransferase [Pseudanabaena sp. FACHB-2040]
MEVVLASFEHLAELSDLFDQYRVFYQQPTDLAAATKFLQDRFKNEDSTLLAAIENGSLAGFTQLYPSFSSVAMKRIWILNDLFVAPPFRKQGVAKLLMLAAEKYARESEAARIVLSTQISNATAQSLYQSLGYCRDEEFYHYALHL